MGYLTVGGCYFADVWDFYIYDEMAKYTGPVIIMHGDADQDVPVSYSERAIEAFPDAELTIVPGMAHSFTDEEFDTFANTIQKMLLETAL